MIKISHTLSGHIVADVKRTKDERGNAVARGFCHQPRNGKGWEGAGCFGMVDWTVKGQALDGQEDMRIVK